MQKKVVVYAHVVSGTQNGIQKIHELGEYLGACAVNEGFDLIGVITEISDKHLYGRRGFIQCLELISRDEVNGVYVLDALNISADKQEIMNFVQSIVEAGAFTKSLKNDLPGESGCIFNDNNTTITDEPSEFVLFYKF